VKRLAVLFACVVVCCLAAAPALADSVSVCKPNTPMTELSGGCAIGNLFFSNFAYNNSGLQVTTGVFATPANILVTATPSGVTFSTNYGFNGGFTNAWAPEEEGEIGYDVSVAWGDSLINGLSLTGGTGPGGVSEIACLGADNPTTANYHNPGMSGYDPFWVSFVCPENPSASALFPRGDSSSVSFSPVSTISVSIGLAVASGLGAFGSLSTNPTVTPFTNEISLVPDPPALLLLIPGLLALSAIKLKKADTA
jgi:hypothetical protein